ncbi:hypothetical protein DFP72DRAFT_817219 [Ephemerocybe angulata]|uniref:RanBP2-type domain-containing protein n=1 Tax=Ephemerocybe angulata TaxID=980116 RepID=A0A8H6M2K1_9AGAR|nr:hypothetical protein DFP72DRAFT_817219 [Tulosesus angulatus]
MDFLLSSNPPQPSAVFRHGDWLCLCAAHNFGRNTHCIACASPRPPTMDHVFYSSAQPQHRQESTFRPPPPPQPQPPKPAQPLLTPSGRAFAVGGRVQNISSDPLAPCIMYWPDNEPFPEQGQIRPSNVVGVAPPILNTGNRGPISHQPGDWICQKCNYLNWRRRKVCQTCLPYAEGNGDSISAAVQAERIALLTQVLSQTSSTSPAATTPGAAPMTAAMTRDTTASPRAHTLTPPQVRSRVPGFQGDGPHAQGGAPVMQMQAHHRPVPRARSHLALGSPSPGPMIYQTGGAATSRQPFASISRTSTPHTQVHAPAPLLPSFLQDMVQSPPSLSPTSNASTRSTSSSELHSHHSSYSDVSPPPDLAADLHLDLERRMRMRPPRVNSGSTDSSGSAGSGRIAASIWEMDEKEGMLGGSGGATPLGAFPPHLEVGHGAGVGVIGMGRVR